ncbi:hypothetical protein ACQ4PT_041995 [Festuca glaucescens]
MASSSSSSRPQRFPENLFLLDNPRPEDGLTLQIFLAAGEGNIRSMKKLAEGLAREGKSMGAMTVNDPLCRRLGPLHFAAWCGKLDMCRFLIKDLHLDVNADADHGSSPLLFAACGRAPKEAVRLLLDRGANPNIACKKGYTVLHVIATLTKRDSSGVAEILLSRGANVDAMCELGTPLHYAAECGNVQMLDMLLQYQANAGADVNAGRPVAPLIIAAADGLTDCVKCLLEAGADANIPNEAVETDPHDSTLYAKRSLCWLHMGEKDKAFNDAYTYKDMDVDLSSSCHEQAAALILTKEYGLACKALLSGLKLDFGRGPVGEVSG